jgi:vacuolar protein sorting-associated protein 16
MALRDAIMIYRETLFHFHSAMYDVMGILGKGNVRANECQGAEEHGVKSVRFWNSGFVALLGNNNLVSVSRYDEPRPKLLATPPSDPVVSWSLISPAHSLSRSVEVLLAIGETIYVVDASECEDRMLQKGPFKHISVSPNDEFVALYTDDGKLWVVNSNFQNKLSEYDSRVKTIPKDMQWCGNNAVALAWEDEVHLVGPNGAASK